MKHYIVGDIHGEYATLLKLVEETPRGSRLIFVGDLVDKGSQSAQVIKFVREHNIACVMGNHEAMMIEYGTAFIASIEEGEPITQENLWLENGGVATLLSYGLVSLENHKMIPHPFIHEFLFQFKEDIAWLKSLPIYLEPKVEHDSGRRVVVSHAAIGLVWALRENKEHHEAFIQQVLWNRSKPTANIPIFNIFGHTPHKNGVDIHGHYVNVDTGCFITWDKAYGRLSAYCLENGEVVSIERVG